MMQISRWAAFALISLALALTPGCSSDDDGTTNPDTGSLEFTPGIYTVRPFMSSVSCAGLADVINTSAPTELTLCNGTGNSPIPINGCRVTITDNQASFSDCDGLFDLSSGGVSCLLRFKGQGTATTSATGFTVSMSGNFEFVDGCLPGVTCTNTTIAFTGTLKTPCSAEAIPLSPEEALALILSPYQP